MFPPLSGAGAIELSVEAKFLTSSQATEIEELRQYRNAYVHLRTESRFMKQLFTQQEDKQAPWEASGEDDPIEGVDISKVPHAEAQRAVKLASAYFLEAGRDALSDG